MSRSLLAVLAALCGLTASALAQAADGSASGGDAQLGKTIADFSARDFHGKPRALAEWSDKQAVVLVFLGVDCPLAKLYAPRLSELSKQYAPHGVQFVGIDSNAPDTPTKLAAFAKTFGIDFPVLHDAGNVVADQIGAARTPEIFVLDRQRVVRYHGRIDDQYAVGASREKVNKRELVSALDEVLAGKAVTQPSTSFTGCIIARAPETAPHGDVTYSQHVASIVNHHCRECHREGELAPFPLTTYDEVAGWAATIREVVSEDRMPPWFADERHGKFSNDCSLAPAEKQTLLTWIDNGCPAGDLAKVPQPPAYTVGWRIGEPDAVYRMPEAFTVPAEGTVEYQHFVIDPQLKEDVWISAAEARPGNAAVVHHIVLFAVPPGVNLSNPGQAQQLGRMIAIYSPGMNPWKYPAGTAVKIEAGTKFVIQGHYTPNGVEQQDRSHVGLKFADPATVKRTVRYGMVVNATFAIPPHAADTEVVAKHRFPKDFLLLNLFPHMHYRGKSFRFEAEYPDGTREVLLDVPRYDFNWQLRYDLTEPKKMPKGTQLICTAHFDNSDANPTNPDPSRTVRFGLQSWEEMLVGYYTIVPAEEDRVAQSAESTKARGTVAGQ